LEQRLAFLVSRQTLLSGDEAEVRKHNGSLLPPERGPMPTEEARAKRRAQVRRLRAAGLTMDAIAQRMRVGHTTVARDLQDAT
jgi:DNA-binding NarL/FixJ family response regulator